MEDSSSADIDPATGVCSANRCPRMDEHSSCPDFEPETETGSSDCFGSGSWELLNCQHVGAANGEIDLHDGMCVSNSCNAQQHEVDPEMPSDRFDGGVSWQDGVPSASFLQHARAGDDAFCPNSMACDTVDGQVEQVCQEDRALVGTHTLARKDNMAHHQVNPEQLHRFLSPVDEIHGVEERREQEDLFRTGTRAMPQRRSHSNVYEGLKHPQPPSVQIRGKIDDCDGAAQRAKIPASSQAADLNRQLRSVGAEVDTYQPFEVLGKGIDEDDGKSILEVIKDHHDAFEHNPNAHLPWHGAVRAKWIQRIREGRVLLSVGEGCSDPDLNGEESMRNGDKLEFIGDTDGCLYGTLALHVHGHDDDAARSTVANQLVDWLLTTGENATYYGEMLRDYVRWDRLPSYLTNGTWDELIIFLRDSCTYIEYTGADWLLLIATTHVFAPVIILHGKTLSAVRFVMDPCLVDKSNALQYDYREEAHLPSSGDAWLRLGLLSSGHYVRYCSKRLQSQVLLQMCVERDDLLQQKLHVSRKCNGNAVIALGPSKAGKSTMIQVRIDVVYTNMFALLQYSCGNCKSSNAYTQLKVCEPIYKTGIIERRRQTSAQNAL